MRTIYFVLVRRKVEKSAGAAQLGVMLLRENDDIAGDADREPDIAKLRKVTARNHFASPVLASLSCSGNIKSAVNDQARGNVHSLVDSYS